MSGLFSAMPEGCDPQAAAEFLRALAHPMRLVILCHLLEGETPVGGFEAGLGLRQPNLSQQLAALRNAGLVVTRREAKSVFYRLADGRVRLVLEALHAAFAAPGATAPEGKPDVTRATRRDGRTTPPPNRLARNDCGVFAVTGWELEPAPAVAGPALPPLNE